MSFNTVTVNYGPCESVHSLLIYKPQKLRGLREHLQKIGFRVKLVRVKYINHCLLEMCGYEVFRCNIQNLRFNTAYEADPICQRAVEAILESGQKLQSARSYLLYWRLINRELFRGDGYSPKDYWGTTVKREKSVKMINIFEDFSDYEDSDT